MRTLKGEIEKKRYEKLMKEWSGVRIVDYIDGTDIPSKVYYPGKVIEEIFEYNTEIVPGEPTDPYLYPVQELQYNLITGDKRMGSSTESAYDSDYTLFSLIWKWVSTLKRIGLIK